MQGMKRNQEVVEFNVSKSDLDDEDLDKIKTYLDTDKGLEKLKFGRNNFTLITPILNMVKTKVSKLKHLDISYL